MSSKITIPALSADGWVSSTILTVDYMLQHYMLSDRSQVSPVGDTRAQSFSAIFAENEGNITATCTALEESLSKYLRGAFSDVEVEVAENKDKPYDDYKSKVALNIYVRFTDSEGKSYNLARMLLTENMKVLDIIKLNNGDIPYV